MSLLSGPALLFWSRLRPYGLVGGIFVLVFFYQSHIFPHGKIGIKKSVQEEYFSPDKPTLSLAQPEKMYEGMIQAKAGDVFRLGFVARSRTEEHIDVILQSSLGDRVTVGMVTVAPSLDNAYHEVVFEVPHRAEDVLLHLTAPLAESKGQWFQPEVYLSSVFVSRLDVRNRTEARRLLPTRYGLSHSLEKSLSLREAVYVDGHALTWSFVAEGDALEALFIPESLLALNGTFSVEKGTDTLSGEALSSVVLDATIREKARVVSGKYRLPLALPLKKGERYTLVFNLPMASPFIGNPGTILNESDDTSLLLAYRSLTTLPQGDQLLNFARLEDLGQELMYSFSVQNKEEDLLNVYALSSKIHFDWKKKRLAGARKKDEYYTYRFDTLYPYERFALEARSGSAKNGIVLEYSYDDTVWQSVPIVRESGQPDRFALALSGTGETRVVFVRIRYTGDEKKTGSFALDRFSVTALINKDRISL